MPITTTANDEQSAILDAPRLWLSAAEGSGQQVVLFRGRWSNTQPTRCVLRFFAESHAVLWLDGEPLFRGPTACHPTRPFAHELDLGELDAGDHVLSVLVRYTGRSSQRAYAFPEPGLHAEVLVDADAKQKVTWRAMAGGGWLPDGPGRTWAAANVDLFDARRSPGNWFATDFDDSAWQQPEALASSRTIRIADLPGMNWDWRPVDRFHAAFRLRGTPATLVWDQAPNLYAKSLMDCDWQQTFDTTVTRTNDGFILDPDDAKTADAIAWCFDLGTEWIGHPLLEVLKSHEGLIEVGMAETIDDRGVPELLRKGGSYVHRITTDGRPFTWQANDYSGLRYLVLIAWHADTPIEVERFGVMASQPAVDWQAAEKHVEAIAAAKPEFATLARSCLHTLQHGTQETIIDCPTREQATYIGDGHPTCRWSHRLTGDARLWRHLVREQFMFPMPDGLIRSAVFCNNNTALLDYDLLAITGAADYLAATGDADTVRQVLPACRGVLRWFLDHRNADGLFDTPMKETQRFHQGGPYEPGEEPAEAFYFPFIDHPGLGWHNKDDPGIDRRGLNCAIQALFSRTLRTFAKLQQTLARDQSVDEYVKAADQIDAVARDTFFNSEVGLFADARLDDGKLTHASEQTNVWAIDAGWVNDDDARAIFRHLLDPSPEQPAAGGATCGPYFLTYLLPQLHRLGLSDLAEAIVLGRYAPMLADGVSTLWETFAGDGLDSRCHAWSSAPLDWMLDQQSM